jgi:hypothetical protein
MYPALLELVRELHDATAAVVEAVTKGDWSAAVEGSRGVLSAGSRLHTRCTVLVDLHAEAGWAAAVDRAVPKPSQELDGQLSIADAPPAKGKAGGRRRS